MLSRQNSQAGHLDAVRQIVNYVEDRVGVGDLDDLPVGKYAVHGGDETGPFLCAVEVVAHEEATAQKILAELLDLIGGQIPVTHFDRA